MSTLLVLSALLACSYLLYLWLLPKPIPGIPYNSEATKNLLGDIPSLAKEVSKTHDVATWFLHQAQKSGSPLTQVFISPLGPFGQPTLLLCDFYEAQDISLHRGKEFGHSPQVSDIFWGIGYNHQIVMETGPEWKARRRLLQDLMTPSFLHNVTAPKLHASTMNLLKLWELKAELADGRPFAVGKDLFHAALDSVVTFAFGDQFQNNATNTEAQLLETSKGGKDEPVEFLSAPVNEVIESMVFMTRAVERVKTSPFKRLKWWFVMREPEMKRAMAIKDGVVYEQLKKAEEARSSYLQPDGEDADNGWIRSAVDHVVDREARMAEKEGRQPDFYSEAITAEVWGFVLAGHDTTSTTLCWALKYLADNQEVQRTLRDSLRRAFPDAKKEGRLPTAEEITRTSIPYLDATLEEVFRFANTIPIISRQTKQDTVLLGHHIPKGTNTLVIKGGPSLLLPSFPVDESKRNPRTREKKIKPWDDEDITMFKPERWLVTDAGGGETSFNSQAGPTIPMGMGTRGCFGRKLGYLGLRINMTLVIWKFNFLPCPKELSGYEGIDGITRVPRQCFVRLKTADEEGH